MTLREVHIAREIPLVSGRRESARLFTSCRRPLVRCWIACRTEGLDQSIDQLYLQTPWPDLVADVVQTLAASRSMPYVVSYYFFDAPQPLPNWSEVRPGVWARRLRMGDWSAFLASMRWPHPVHVIRTRDRAFLRELVNTEDWSRPAGVLIALYPRDGEPSDETLRALATRGGFTDADFDAASLLVWPAMDGYELEIVGRHVDTDEVRRALETSAAKYAVPVVAEGM